MRVIVNGEPREISSARVDALLGELEYEGTHFAIALNFDVLPKSRWAETPLKSGDEIEFSRPVRLIHPRWPLYIIPRADHQFMIGATTIEAEDSGVSVRSALELLSAAYAVHPAFAEARIVEFGSGLRPAFPDNLPRIAVKDDKISVNGLYRHGFLLAPALAELTLGYVERGVIDNEVMQCA